MTVPERIIALTSVAKFITLEEGLTPYITEDGLYTSLPVAQGSPTVAYYLQNQMGPLLFNGSIGIHNAELRSQETITLVMDLQTRQPGAAAQGQGQVLRALGDGAAGLGLGAAQVYQGQGAGRHGGFGG